MARGTKEQREREQLKVPTLTLVVDYDPKSFDIQAVRELIAKAREHGAVLSAVIINLPTEMDLTND